jgi:hypothetical protein
MVKKRYAGPFFFLCVHNSLFINRFLFFKKKHYARAVMQRAIKIPLSVWCTKRKKQTNRMQGGEA